MAGIRITELSIAEVIDNLRSAKWQVPKFQREFVWDTSAVAGLATSVLDAYPIGMVTLWEQSSKNPLELERLSISDYDPGKKKQVTKRFGHCDEEQNLLAILDGRQRCTALAMAFAGFSPIFGGNRYAGRYFLNAFQQDPLERVVFIKKRDLEKRALTSTSSCIGKGLFPLSSEDSNKSVVQQWLEYVQEIKNPRHYDENLLPHEDELNRRNEILTSAFNGITSTKLGACTVPESYDLGQICEIFETLNVTGMKVSTVDLINAWIYSETESSGSKVLHLREWMRDLGDIEGAIGWSMPEKRPELIAQMATACFVALDDHPDKPPPRHISGAEPLTRITSVKSRDLLATPPEHWMNIVENESIFAEFVGDFQKCVAKGPFPHTKSPYPISACIYVAIRWHKKFDPNARHDHWRISDLDSLFRAFYWRNALSRRYDQGFLTTLGADISFLKILLRRRSSFDSLGKWLVYCDDRLSSELIRKADLPTKQDLKDLLTDGRPGGAMQLALQLPMLAAVEQDMEGIRVSPGASDSAELHHIFPKRWCADNCHGQHRDVLNKEIAGRDWVNSLSNLMPLSRKTNNAWKTKYPATYIEETHVTYDAYRAYFDAVFIGREEFDLLRSEQPRMLQFWQARAAKMADKLIELTNLSA